MVYIYICTGLVLLCLSNGKNALCLEMAFALNMVNPGQTMVMPAT